MAKESEINRLLKRQEKTHSSIARVEKIRDGIQNRTLPNLANLQATLGVQIESLRGGMEKENLLPIVHLDYDKVTAQINDGEERKLTDFEWELIAYFGDKKNSGEDEVSVADLTAHAKEMGASGNSASYLVSRSIKGIRNKFSDFPDLLVTSRVAGRVSNYKLNARVEVVGDDEEPSDGSDSAQKTGVEVGKEGSTVMLETPRDLAVPKGEVPQIINKIVGNLWDQLSPLDRANLKEAFFQHKEALLSQIDQMARYIVEFRRGKVETPSPSEILKATTTETKKVLAASKLRSLIFLSLIEPQHPAIRTVFGWGKQLNDLMLLLGGENGREKYFSGQ